MNTLNAFGYIGMSLMQLNDFSFIQVNDEPDNEINVFQHMFAMVFIMKKHQRLFHRVCHVESVRGDNPSYNGYLHADFNHVNG